MSVSASAESQSGPLVDSRWTTRWHLLLIGLVSAGYESLFLRHGLNLRDEGWPLYAAKMLHEGGRLYTDIFWVYPPGHVLPAWIGYAIAPPGILVTRWIYAAFAVALSLSLYLLARKLMPPSFALLASLLLAVVAPTPHMGHNIFGYRYLAIGVFALLAFARRVESGRSAWLFLAGSLTGLALFFRLTPAFAVACGLAIGVFSLDSDWRRWLRDSAWALGGFLLVVVPVLAWFAAGVGLATLWQESVVHPLAMLQGLPPPGLRWPDFGSREQINAAWVALQFRVWGWLYVGYLVVLLGRWFRSLKRRERFDSSLVLAVVVVGGVYFFRTMGRSDVAHLTSAIPPVCLLVSHLLSRLWGLAVRSQPERRRAFIAAFCVIVVFAGWVFLWRSDRLLDRHYRGMRPLRALDGQINVTSHGPLSIDLEERIETIRRCSSPGDRVLDLSALPMLLVITDRPGYGWRDVLEPGTFFDEGEEVEFLARVQAAPPVLVVQEPHAFDFMEERSVRNTAPRVSSWVEERYAPVAEGSRFIWVEAGRRGPCRPGSAREGEGAEP